MSYEEKLFHDSKAFLRKTLSERMQTYGFKNMGRLELFLWDLEIFLQIQSILGDRIVLKGGAAVQFYLPIEAQRTSVDIDMIFFGSKDEIEETLAKITDKLSENDVYFHFKPHRPKNPKTDLPLYTYYTKIPTVLLQGELNKGSGNKQDEFQEIKIEFIQEYRKAEYIRKVGSDIFAVNSPFEYQVLPISNLFADKLTTLGCNTIGVQDDRMDEQVKQFYDVMMISRCCYDELSFENVRAKYLARAEREWSDRKKDEPFSLECIISDVCVQLDRYAAVDCGEDAELKKHIADFKGLYLNSRIEFTPQSVSCAALRIKMMYLLMMNGQNWDCVRSAIQMEDTLELAYLSGREKGAMVKELRTAIVEEFSQYSSIPAKILKAKGLKRVFWAVAQPDNLDEIEKMIQSKLANDMLYK